MSQDLWMVGAAIGWSLAVLCFSMSCTYARELKRTTKSLEELRDMVPSDLLDSAELGDTIIFNRHANTVSFRGSEVTMPDGVFGGHDTGYLSREDAKRPHPDHCLCDSCVTPDNLSERIRLSEELAEKNNGND